MSQEFWIFWILSVSIGCLQISALHMTDITVPEVVDYRERATLSCSYNMGKHALNSVKWYKDEMEFFRYSPMMHPTILKFNVSGVTLAEGGVVRCNKYTCDVTLVNLSQRTSGVYRCEISGDAPEFKLISQMGNMSVAAIPQHDPIISDLLNVYALGDFVQANCTTDKSNPPATLSWIINDSKAPPEYLQPQQETTVQSNGMSLRHRSSELRFFVDKMRFDHIKSLSIKCVAKIDRFPSLSRETKRKIQIMSQDELNNQKLINLRKNTGDSVKLHYAMHVSLLAIIVCINVRFIS